MLKISPETYTSIYRVLFLIEETKENYQKANEIKNRYISLSDSIHSEISQKKVLEIQEKYNHEKFENENQKLMLQQKNSIIWGLISSIAVIIITAALFNMKRKKTRVEKLMTGLKRKLQITEKYNNSLKKTLKNYLDKEKLKNKEYFEKVFSHEIIELKKLNANLSNMEISICCLTYCGFDNNEIVNILNLSKKAIHSRNTEIRNKLEIGKRGNIADFLATKL
jgi:ATP/maltotriose-dependent transcriptional regulator MalT